MTTDLQQQPRLNAETTTIGTGIAAQRSLSHCQRIHSLVLYDSFGGAAPCPACEALEKMQWWAEVAEKRKAEINRLWELIRKVEDIIAGAKQ